MRTLYLPLQKEWYEMIESGVKTEEYREIKTYWEKRLLEYDKMINFIKKNMNEIIVRRVLNYPLIDFAKVFSKDYKYVRFSYGYTKRTMTFEVESIRIGKGKYEWGAPIDKDVFIIKLGKRL